MIDNEKLSKVKSVCEIPLIPNETIMDMGNYKDEAIVLVTSEYRIFYVFPSGKGFVCKEVILETNEQAQFKTDEPKCDLCDILSADNYISCLRSDGSIGYNAFCKDCEHQIRRRDLQPNFKFRPL